MEPTNPISRQIAAEMAYTSRAYEPVDNPPKNDEYLYNDQAKAEMRRIMAVAADPENSAKVRDMEAKYSEALAAVPQAMAKAIEKTKHLERKISLEAVTGILEHKV